MSPYTTAWSTWHSQGRPVISWEELIAHFFCFGVVISTPDAFILARPMRADDSDTEHLRLSRLQSPPDADCWNVWLAAGRLTTLLALHDQRPLPWISFCRRGEDRIRRVEFARLARHALTEDSQAPASGTPSGLRHRSRESRRGSRNPPPHGQTL